MELKKYNHIQYCEIDGQLFRIIGLFRFPIKSLEEEAQRDRERIELIKTNGYPAPFPDDFQSSENWEDTIDLPTGVYPSLPVVKYEDD